MAWLVVALCDRVSVPAASAQSTPEVDALVAAMTLDEKLAMLIGSPIAGVPDPSGISVGYLPGVPRLGVPPLRFADGPAGVRANNNAFSATVLPAPVALAATFSSEQALRYGQVLGAEVVARGEDALFGPMINLARVPTAGRNFETLGEDPTLQAQLAVPQILGIQSQGAMAVLKHFASNNQEHNRMWVNVNIDERTFRETELFAFETAVKSAAPSGMMCAYNKVNGSYSCENRALLTDILRGEWNFEGFVVSDYGANRSARAALEAGLDVEFLTTFFSGMPLPEFPGVPALSGGPSLRELLADGTLEISSIDNAVRRLLLAMETFGLLDEASPHGGFAVERERLTFDATAGARVSQQVAEQGAVLLKNDPGGLPLTARDLDNLLVVGPTALVPLIGGGGSSRVIPEPDAVRSPIDVLSDRARNPNGLRFETGVELDGEPIPASALSPQPGAPQHGLLRTLNPQGSTQLDSQINFVATDQLSSQPAESSWTWSGWLTAPSTGDYELRLQVEAAPKTLGPAGFTARAVLDGSIVIGSVAGLSTTNASLLPTADGLQNTGLLVHLEAGVARRIEITANSSPTAGLQLRLAWITPALRAARKQAALTAAPHARAVVVFAYEEATEGVDRTSLSLPRDQDALIAALAAINPRTIVILNTGGPITMPWERKVRSILQAWYPGQAGAQATVALLLGDTAPSGKLPVTFPARLEDNPTYSADGRRYPGVPVTDGAPSEQYYDEGILVGYRWYDEHELEPAFPFGHGLSYTVFRYSGLAIRPADQGDLEVSVTVRNRGAVRGAEIVQVYLNRSSHSPVPMPPRKLVGFARVDLRPGEVQRVAVRVPARNLSYWSIAAHDWQMLPLPLSLSVGSSSRDIRLTRVVRKNR